MAWNLHIRVCFPPRYVFGGGDFFVPGEPCAADNAVENDMHPPHISQNRSRFLKILTLVLVFVLIGVGYWLWQSSGELRFEAVALENGLTVTSGQGGTVTDLYAREGQLVRQGQALLAYRAPSPQELESETEKLRALSLALPPDRHFLPSPLGGKESLVQRSERQRLDEQTARERVLEAAQAVSQAEVTYNRAVSLRAQRKLAPAQEALAEKRLNEARARAEDARQAFERLSRLRAATDADIRRLSQARFDSGADRIPTQEREQAYDLQYARVERMHREARNPVLAAPHDGTVLRVLVGAGRTLPPGAPCFVLRALDMPVVFQANVPMTQAASLAPGTPCVVDVNQFGQGLSAVVDSLEPSPEAPSIILVRIRLEAWNTPVPPGTAATVTALTRNVPVATGNREAPPADVAAPITERPLPSSGAAPAAPLSLVDSFGAAKSADGVAGNQNASAATPPVVRAGSPEALGQTPTKETVAAPDAGEPLLPPMKAPYPLKDSPLPRPDNNPSIVPQHVLDPPAGRP
jgi:multidrug resistance efflux pump